MKYNTLITCLFFLLLGIQVFSQTDIKAYEFTGIVYDEGFNPIPYTHVIAEGTGQGDVTDSLGIFTLYIRETDRLFFYNLTCEDSSIIVQKDISAFNIRLKRRIYLLKEAKVFDWGSSYGDFLQEAKRQGPAKGQGEKIGLPVQDPEVIPFDMDEKRLKSPGFLISSPISFFYYNFSKREKAARKAFKLKQNEDEIDIFQQTLSQQNISSITSLEGEELEDFILYLNDRITCTFKCSELEILSEIFNIWSTYKDERGLNE